MNEASHNQSFPHGALLAVAALIGFSLCAVVLTKFDGVRDFRSTNLAADETLSLQSRDLRFEDRDNGYVDIFDASDHTRLLVMQPGSENFIRGVLRGLVRERRSMNLGSEMPFRLIKVNDGQLILKDLATNRQIHLNAFGHTNAAAFARLLDSSEG